MPTTKPPALPLLVEAPSVIRLYIRLAILSLLIGVCAVIAGIVGGVVRDRLLDVYRRWLNYLE